MRDIDTQYDVLLFIRFIIIGLLTAIVILEQCKTDFRIERLQKQLVTIQKILKENK